MIDVETRATELCASPIGCAFLLLAEENAISSARLAEPSLATLVAARALNETRRFFQPHDAVVTMALDAGPRLLPFARAVLLEPPSARWYCPVDLDGQEWLGAGTDAPVAAALPSISVRAPSSPPTRRERYAQAPSDSFVTSTAIEDGISSALAALMYFAGDYYLGKPPLPRYRVRPTGTPKIVEVNGPRDWHRWSVRYPALDEEGRLTPDWGAMAVDWDGLHLTLGGLLTASQVRVESDAGWSELQFWDFEQTVWLRWSLADVERLPDVTDLNSPLSIRKPVSFWTNVPEGYTVKYNFDQHSG